MVKREVIEKALEKPFKGFTSAQSEVLSGKVRDWYSLPGRKDCLSRQIGSLPLTEISGLSPGKVRC